MTLTAIIAAIGSIGAILGAIVFFMKWGTWAVTKPPAQTDAEIDKQAQADLQKAQETGRPQ